MMPDRVLAEIVLAVGPLRARLAPELGGAVAALTWSDGAREWPVLRPPPPELGSVLETASFPLVPFANRIRGGAFAMGDRIVRLTANFPPDPSPIHGQGWQNGWSVVAQDQAGAELVFAYRPGEWPWAYEARQLFALDADGLTVILTCTNRSEEPMPCGLGQHPYFPCTSETRLATEVEQVWEIDENILPTQIVAAEGRYDLSDRLVCGQGLDHGFGGWGGSARFDDPAWPFTIRMSSPEAGFFQLYSPPEGGFVAAEPVGQANAALNAPESDWPGLGIEILPPGGAKRLTMRVEIQPRNLANTD